MCLPELKFLFFPDLLWFDCILLIFLQEIIDVVVVNFDIGDKNAVAAVLVGGI